VTQTSTDPTKQNRGPKGVNPGAASEVFKVTNETTIDEIAVTITTVDETAVTSSLYRVGHADVNIEVPSPRFKEKVTELWTRTRSSRPIP
jgi:hypothetical protein